MTPDWADNATAVPYANFGNPQSLNLYSFVENNPTTTGDPDGHCVGDLSGDTECGTPVPYSSGTMALEMGDATTIASHKAAQNNGCRFFCRLWQRFSNAFGGYGFHTDQQVRDTLQRDSKWLRKNTSFDVEHMTEKQIMEVYNAIQSGDSSVKADGKRFSFQIAGAVTSTNQMNKQVERGQAPKSVDRVDPARVPGEKPHVEFNDGNALNNDGTWKHGGRALTNAERDWLVSNGWSLPQ